MKKEYLFWALPTTNEQNREVTTALLEDPETLLTIYDDDTGHHYAQRLDPTSYTSQEIYATTLAEEH
jgi:hypothetical protein